MVAAAGSLPTVAGRTWGTSPSQVRPMWGRTLRAGVAVLARGYVRVMPTTPIILVPGFWLGAWAWDEVAAALRAEGHDVTALTLPGLESAAADRSDITFSDHVDAICDAVLTADSPTVVAVHSAAGFSGYAASDRVPERIAAMVYVDSAPGIAPLDPSFDAVEKPLNWDELAAE